MKNKVTVAEVNPSVTVELSKRQLKFVLEQTTKFRTWIEGQGQYDNERHGYLDDLIQTCVELLYRR